MVKKASKSSIKTKRSAKVLPVKTLTKTLVKEKGKDELTPISKEVEKALEEVDEKIDDPEVPVAEEVSDVMTEEDFSPDIDEADTKEEW